jgi:F-type H+-transporting ATPase subunit alpha
MESDLRDFFADLRRTAGTSRFSVAFSEAGKVLSVGDGIVQVGGLRDAKLNELIEFDRDSWGIAFDLHADRIGVVLLAGGEGLKAGDAARKTNRIAVIEGGESLLGRVINALGKPIDGGPPPENLTLCPIDRIAPPLLYRDFISNPLYTGIKVIDAMLAIGRGQRALIVGDHASGKTALAVDTVINQKTSDVISIYVSIGQSRARLLKTIDEIKTHGEPSRTVILAADSGDSVGFQFLAPYSATAIAEFFMDRGRDVLIVYDDLSKHADAYRSLSLLLKRPPGREAYPGDIFFLHSRLLERSTRIHRKYGGGSLTALPIVETQQGRIASYIPTNLISITDGQIYLDSNLFNKGIRPAVDVTRSVSRIGGKAQIEAMRSAAEKLKIDYSRFLEVEIFTRFGARVEEETEKLLRRGRAMREILKQPRFRPLPVEDQILVLLILESGALDGLEPDKIVPRCGELLAGLKNRFPEAAARLGDEGRFSGLEREEIDDFLAGEEA